jgi:hypothetical protein
MTVGMWRTRLEGDIRMNLTGGHGHQIDRELADKVARAVAAAIEKNNQEITRQLSQVLARAGVQAGL